jgi:hypothetical protein
VFEFGFLDGHGAARDSRDRGSEVIWRRPEIIGEIIEIAANSTSLMVTFHWSRDLMHIFHAEPPP